VSGYGIFNRPGETPRVGFREGGTVFDLSGLDDVFRAPSLNAFMAEGQTAWAEARARVSEGTPVPAAEVELHLPFEVADYIDFYSSLEHATNLGKLFRPGAEPLLPNWRHLPVGYHGRAGTIVVSGTPIRRPHGQSKPPDADAPAFGPSRRLDIELELGFVIGASSRLGEPVAVDSALEHVFGVVLVNDWSARDIQAWEYQPLGPFLGKSFATSISPWIVPLEALEPHRVAARPQDPEPLPYLRTDEDWALDIELEVALAPERGEETVVSRTNARGLYWTAPQQLAHATVNGTNVRPGDLYASGTISGAEPGTAGSLLELTWGGRDPLALTGGGRRSFLEDGDSAILRGRAGAVSLGEVRGRILPSV